MIWVHRLLLFASAMILSCEVNASVGQSAKSIVSTGKAVSGAFGKRIETSDSGSVIHFYLNAEDFVYAVTWTGENSKVAKAMLGHDFDALTNYDEAHPVNRPDPPYRKVVLPSGLTIEFLEIQKADKNSRRIFGEKCLVI